jgi:hypothetical protein
MRITGGLVALLSASIPAIASATDQEPIVAQTCELHVWPSDKLKSVYFGWVHGGTVDGAQKGRSGYPALPSDPIPTNRQAQLLEAAEPQKLLGRADDRLIVHADALDSRTIRTTPGRLGDSKATCYGELVVDDIVFRQDVVAGTVLMTLFRYRRFGADPVAEYRFANWAKSTVTLLPLRPGADVTAAITELEGAYVGDLKNFAELVRKQASRNDRRAASSKGSN